MTFEFVDNNESYYEFIRLLRTNPATIEGFVENVQITPEQQKAYMAQYGKNYYVCLVDGVPAGFIGSIENDIRIATLPKYQRKGVGSFMVKELLKRHPDAYAKIKVDNEISLNFFRKLGFKQPFYFLFPGKEMI